MILSQFNPIHILTTHFLYIRLYINRLSPSRFSFWTLPYKNTVCISCLHNLPTRSAFLKILCLNILTIISNEYTSRDTVLSVFSKIFRALLHPWYRSFGRKFFGINFSASMYVKHKQTNIYIYI